MRDADAERLTHRIHIDAGAGAVGEIALQQFRRADTIFHHLETALHVARRIGQRLAVFAAQRLGQLVHVAVQQADEFRHHPRATLRVDGRPISAGRRRRSARRAPFPRPRQGRPVRWNFTRRGMVDVRRPTRCTGHVAAVDVMADLLQCCASNLIPPERFSLKSRLGNVPLRSAVQRHSDRFRERSAMPDNEHAPSCARSNRGRSLGEGSNAPPEPTANEIRKWAMSCQGTGHDWLDSRALLARPVAHRQTPQEGHQCWRTHEFLDSKASPGCA